MPRAGSTLFSIFNPVLKQNYSQLSAYRFCHPCYVLGGADLTARATRFGIHPNMSCTWKKALLEGASDKYQQQTVTIIDDL
jgi:hypothetical protein